jgi:hypothetical protein
MNIVPYLVLGLLLGLLLQFLNGVAARLSVSPPDLRHFSASCGCG